ncbi:MAG: hypothetical protein ACXWLH_00255 [Candidatus Saccharimonadales bacterium]
MYQDFAEQLTPYRRPEIQSLEIPAKAQFALSVEKPVAELPDGRKVVMSLDWGTDDGSFDLENYPEMWVVHDSSQDQYALYHPSALLTDKGSRIWNNTSVMMGIGPFRGYPLTPNGWVAIGRNGQEQSVSESLISRSDLGYLATSILTGFVKIADIQLTDNRHIIVKNKLIRDRSIKVTNAV